MTYRWITGDSFFMPVTRARRGWRAWIPVVLYTGAFAAVIWLGFNGLTPVEFDTGLLPESCRITYTLDRTRRHTYDLDGNLGIVWPVSAHDVYFRYPGKPRELADELRASPLMRQFRECRGDDLTFVRYDGRVVLSVSGGDSVFPWDRTSYLVHSDEYAEPQPDYMQRAGI
jgi:hypothetical protein